MWGVLIAWGKLRLLICTMILFSQIHGTLPDIEISVWKAVWDEHERDFEGWYFWRYKKNKFDTCSGVKCQIREQEQGTHLPIWDRNNLL